MSDQITPGPWRIKSWSGDEAYIVATNPSTGKDMHVTLTCTNGDARAIRLVPEMVDALRTIMNRKWDSMSQGCDAACEAQKAARDLISKLEAPHG